MPEDREYNYWVVTESEQFYGPFDDFAKAFHFAWENLAFDGWTVTVS